MALNSFSGLVVILAARREKDQLLEDKAELAKMNEKPSYCVLGLLKELFVFKVGAALTVWILAASAGEGWAAIELAVEGGTSRSLKPLWQKWRRPLKKFSV